MSQVTRRRVAGVSGRQANGERRSSSTPPSMSAPSAWLNSIMLAVARP